jgi:hypothetical protein
MPVIPGHGELFAFGDPTAPPPDWRKEMPDNETDDDRELTLEERAALKGQLGFDPAMMGQVQLGYSYTNTHGRRSWAAVPADVPKGATDVKRTRRGKVTSKVGDTVDRATEVVADAGRAVGRRVSQAAQHVHQATADASTPLGSAIAGGSAVEHEAVSMFNEIVGRLPPRAQKAVHRAIQIASSTYTVGRQAAERFAAAAGADAEKVARIGKTLAFTDIVLAKVSYFAAEHGLHWGFAASTGVAMVPFASVGFLAFAAARHPKVTLGVARAAVAKVRSIVKLASPLAMPADVLHQVSTEAATVADTELYLACFAAALDETGGDAGQSANLAKQAYEEAVKQPPSGAI